MSAAATQIALGIACIAIVICLVMLASQRLRTGPRKAMDKDHPTLTRLEIVEERQTATEHDIRSIRAALDGLPSKEAVHRLEVEMAKLAGKVETVDTVVLATQRATDRIETFLLSGATGAKAQ